MGSINSRPKAPAVQPSSVTTVTPTVTPSTVSTPTKTSEELASESRTESLLRRSRGRLGTVLTGFKGFLSSSNQGEEVSRKTLLGE